MAIRLVHQPIGIGGLAAYAAGRGRAQERQLKYAAAARPRSRAVAPLEGRFIDPLAVDPALAAPAGLLGEAPVADGRFLTPAARESEAEAERRRNLITQRAQYQGAARAGRMGRRYQGNLLPYFVPQAEIDRRQKLADEERDRAFILSREEAARNFTLDRDRADAARDNMLARRRAIEREAGSLTIPDWVSPRDRIELEKRKSAVGEFARPDVDLTDPAVSEAYSGATDSFYGYLEGLKPPDPTEGEFYRHPVTGEKLDAYEPGAVRFGADNKPIDLPPTQKDLAAEQTAQLRDEYNKAYSTRLKSLLGTTNEEDGKEYTFEAADKKAKDYAANVMRGLMEVHGDQTAAIARPDSRSDYSSARQQQRTSVAQPVSQPAVVPPEQQGLSQRTRGGLAEALREVQQPAPAVPGQSPAAPSVAEFNATWAKASPGDIVLGPDGKLYTKKGR